MSNSVFAYLTQATETVTSTFVQNGETLTSYYVQAARGAKGDTGSSTAGAVLYTAQTLTSPQQVQARANIGAASTVQGAKADTALQQVPSVTRVVPPNVAVANATISGDLFALDLVTPVVFPVLYKYEDNAYGGNFSYSGLPLTGIGVEYYLRNLADFSSISKLVNNVTVGEWTYNGPGEWVSDEGMGTADVDYATTPILTAAFIGQRCNVGAAMPYKRWECTGPALTDWTQLSATTADQISDSTAAGRALITAANAAAQKTALAITAANITDSGTTGRSVLQAATVAAASETLGFRGTAAASTVTTSTKDEWVDVSASITIPAGVYHGMVNATFGNATSSSTHFRLLFGSGAVFSSTSDLIGNGVVYTSVGFISGSSSTGAATIGASNSSAITSIPMSASFVVNIPAQTTVKLQVANTSATGTSSVWRHALRLHKP